jgi:hypothetical protein
LQPAAAGSTIRHDLLRGVISSFKEPPACTAAALVSTTWSEPPAACAPAPGDGCWYLVNASDGCGRGSYGAEQTVCMDACTGAPIPGCPVCGNARVEGHEECDGADLEEETCVSQGYDGGALGCTAACVLDRSGCTTVCGDGMIRGEEECDGANLRGRRCYFYGFDGGTLSCTPSCDFDLSGCCCTDGTPGCPVCPECGNGVREAPYELCDGYDTGPATCVNQGHLPGTLRCNYNCDGFDYSECTGL